jgi:hypothetical protein
MDFSHFPEIANYLVHSFQVVAPHIHETAHSASETCRNMAVALCEMPPSEKAYHLTKLGIASAGLVFGIATRNAGAIAGFAIPEIEEIRELNKAGRHIREARHDKL